MDLRARLRGFLDILTRYNASISAGLSRNFYVSLRIAAGVLAGARAGVGEAS